jgi:hypothetical protein
VTIIGVDSSGHVKNPPIWVIAARRSKKSGQKSHAIYISVEKHCELEKCTKNTKNWFEKVCAILIFKAVTPIFYDGDTIIIDKDFQGSEPYIEKYLKKLLQDAYSRNPRMANPTVLFIPDYYNKQVKEAHIKVQNLRHKRFHCSCEKDPSLEKELSTL